MPKFTLEHAVLILLIAGALNWGLVAAGQEDVVKKFVPSPVDLYVKYAIAAAGLYQLYILVTEFTA
jgi:uncharacterized membrane protein YuzA (DUF378 family)